MTHEFSAGGQVDQVRVWAAPLFGGRLADRFGGRPVLVAGLAVFAAASAVVPAASGFGVLAASRFGQGIGRPSSRRRPWSCFARYSPSRTGTAAQW